MRKIIAIAITRLLQFFKQPTTTILMLVMPLFFTAVFGALLSDDVVSNRPHVGVIASTDRIANEAQRLLVQNEQFTWLTLDRNEAEKQIKERKIIAAVLLPDDIVTRMDAQQAVIDLIVRHESGDTIALVPIVEGVGRIIRTAYFSLGDGDRHALHELLSTITPSGSIALSHRAQQIETPSFSYVNLSSLGFTIMFMMFGISSAASTILDERKDGTWSRLLTTPTSKLEILTGYLLSFFLMGWIQFSILMTAMTLFFGVNWGNLFYLIPFVSLLILTVVGFGLMMAGVVKSRQQAGVLSAIIIVSTCMIGGVYWPLEITPPFMQMLAMGVPQSWAIQGFQEIIGGSLRAEPMWLSVTMLVLFAVGFFAIGITRLKFE